MEIEGIDRLVFGVKDMDRALSFFNNVLGVSLTEIEGPLVEAAGCRLAISLDKKLELLSPVGPPQVETIPPEPLALKRRLDASDAEAILYAVVYKVPDYREAIGNAAKHGVRTKGDKIEFERDEQFGWSNMEEIALHEDDTLGVRMAFAQYDRD